MSDALQKQSTAAIRDTDPNVLQNRASNPDISAWVGASAGSGKTKVLTDRILRLLLPNKKGFNASAPHKLLAITFTKAAASEMALRIQQRLSQWAIMDLEGEKGLKKDLKNLLGEVASEKQIQYARKLFAEVVDAPGGLKIMTIHSFCQSILGRFPLEADIAPGFTPLEEPQAEAFLQQAQKIVFAMCDDDENAPLIEVLNN